MLTHLFRQNQCYCKKELDGSAVTRYLIATEIEKCFELSLLRSYILKRFPKTVEQYLYTFLRVKKELPIEDGIILKGSRVFIPPKFRKFVIDELHSAHQGISAVKLQARSYEWRAEIDNDLETRVKSCVVCQQNVSALPAKQVY